MIAQLMALGAVASRFGGRVVHVALDSRAFDAFEREVHQKHGGPTPQGGCDREATVAVGAGVLRVVEVGPMLETQEEHDARRLREGRDP